MSNKRTAMIVGPTRVSTFRAVMPLVAYVFSRLLGHVEDRCSGAPTLRQIEILTFSVCTEYGAVEHYEHCRAAVVAAVDVLMGGVLEDA